MAAAAVCLAVCLATGIAAAKPALAGPILFEVCYDGNGTDADDAFTEIFGTPGAELIGWSLQGVNGSNGSVYRTVSIPDTMFPEDGLLVLATSSAAGAVLSARDVTANVDWQNGPDAVLLLNPDGNVADALQYGTLQGWHAGEGNPAVDVSAGWSLSRDVWASDTGDNATDFAALSAPTPGVGPGAPVPEPGTFALLLAGGGAFCTVRRRGRRDRQG
jgi:hypothetical protein